MRRRIFIGNWKMHKTPHEAGRYVSDLWPLLRCTSTVDVILAPPFTALHTVASLIKDTTLGLAGQDVHWEPSGSFTGEVSATMLYDSGCQAVIIGHSERRRMFYEDDTAINRKVKASLSHGLTAIMCVGETREERDDGRTSEIISRQLFQGLAGIETLDHTQLILAYEPAWAIGTGTSATPTQASEVHAELRQHLETLFTTSIGESIRVIYGGSITKDNIQNLLAVPHIDGGLVGRACLDPREFAMIVNAVGC